MVNNKKEVTDLKMFGLIVGRFIALIIAFSLLASASYSVLELYVENEWIKIIAAWLFQFIAIFISIFYSIKVTFATNTIAASNKNGLIKKLIITYYDEFKPSYKLEIYSQEKNSRTNLFDLLAEEANNDFNTQKVYKTLLKGDGKFNSEECVKIMQEADIIVTNPPFSLFSEFISLLMKCEKKFLIIGNKNAIAYKNIFPLLKENIIYLGYNNIYKFIKPDGTIQNFGNICWFTNLVTNKMNEELILTRNYYKNDGKTPLEDSYINYPKYYNCDAINVNKIQDMPKDYYGIMGVPISFLEKYNPNQFEIIGMDLNCYNQELGIKEIGQKWIDDYKKQGGKAHLSSKMHSLVGYGKDGKTILYYKRIFIKKA